MDFCHQVKTLVFDKTGTITKGKPALSKLCIFVPESFMNFGEIVAVTASAESNSEHPIATAVAKFGADVLKLIRGTNSSSPVPHAERNLSSIEADPNSDGEVEVSALMAGCGKSDKFHAAPGYGLRVVVSQVDRVAYEINGHPLIKNLLNESREE